MSSQRSAAPTGSHRTALQALRLRAWAACVLLSEEPYPPLPAAPAAAWRFFLLMEWCALPLEHRLRELGVLEQLDEGAQAALHAAAQLEASRIGSARDLLRDLDRFAAATGARILVLKGGVAVAGGATMHVEDIDVLVDAQGAEALIARFDPARKRGLWTLGQYRIAAPAQDAALEVHTLVRELSGEEPAVGAVALPHHEALLRPRDALHLRHVLIHPLATHPDRIARIRDLLLLRATLAASSAAAQREVREHFRDSVFAIPIEGLLQAARGGGLPPALERCVRRRYFLLARWAWLGRARPLQMLLTIAAELTAPPRARIIRKVFQAPDRPSAMPGFGAIFRRAPWLDRALRLAWRPLLLLAAGGLSAGAAAESGLTRVAD